LSDDSSGQNVPWILVSAARLGISESFAVPKSFSNGLVSDLDFAHLACSSFALLHCHVRPRLCLVHYDHLGPLTLLYLRFLIVSTAFDGAHEDWRSRPSYVPHPPFSRQLGP
jgi:hypothetical protein